MKHVTKYNNVCYISIKYFETEISSLFDSCKALTIIPLRTGSATLHFTVPAQPY